MDIPTTPALAQLVEEAMKHLTHEDVVARGGPSSPTITKVLAGAGEPISPVTAKKLEKAFQWQEGTVARTALGETPEALQEIASGAGRILRKQLQPRLAGVTDYELLAEVGARMLLMASRLHELGEDSLEVIVDDEDDSVVTSRPRSSSSET